MKGNTRTVCLFANTDWYLYNFRADLLRRLKEAGWRVVVVSPAGRYAELLQRDFEWRQVELGSGIVGVIRAAREVRRVYRDIRPNLVHHFTIKPVILGGISSRRFGIPSVHAITGLGHVFTDDRLINRILRRGVKAVYQYVMGAERCRVVFQNEDDHLFFVNSGVVPDRKCSVIRGSGVNVKKFLPADGMRRKGPVRVLFASRLIREKGVVELVKAARSLRSAKVEFELLIAGERYPGNPSSLSSDEVDALAKEFRVLGHVEDMAELLVEADIVALPSYAEGTPRILLEAIASGKPIVATDIAGCRGVVEDGQNGYLVQVRDWETLAQRLRVLIADHDLRLAFGRESRRIALAKFDEESVNAATIELYEELLASAEPCVS